MPKCNISLTEDDEQSFMDYHIVTEDVRLIKMLILGGDTCLPECSER